MSDRWSVVLGILLLVGCGPKPPEAAPVVVMPEKPLVMPEPAPFEEGPRFEFQGDTPGVTTLEAFTKQHGEGGRHAVTEVGVDVPGAVNVVIEGSELKIGEDPVEKGTYTFVDGVLERVFLTVKSSKEKVSKALSDKYGKPYTVSEALVWTRKGADLVVSGNDALIAVICEDQALADTLKSRIAHIRGEKDGKNQPVLNEPGQKESAPNEKAASPKATDQKEAAQKEAAPKESTEKKVGEKEAGENEPAKKEL